MYYPEQLALPAIASGLPTLNVIHHMDAIKLLKALPDASVDCVVTSPPYYALRDYGVDGQIGLEDTPAQFIERLMQIFREVHRVLKPTGTVWVNLGDSYSGSGRNGGTESINGSRSRVTVMQSGRIPCGTLPAKSLMMIPARFAIAMQDEGWILRSEIIWAKRAPMPESVTDRPTKAHEMIYLFAKEGRYFYDQEAVREKATYAGHRNSFGNKNAQARMVETLTGNMKPGVKYTQPTGRNLRDVWHLSPEPTSAEHFAAYPTEIPRRCILAGCPEKVCTVCGKPYERVVEKTGGTTGKSWHDHSNDQVAGMHQMAARESLTKAKSESGQPYTRIDRGLQPACTCNVGTKPGVVLDFFSGTGTTAYMARKLGRSYIGCDLNADYVAMARRRLADSDPYQHRQVTPELRQRSMFAGMQP